MELDWTWPVSPLSRGFVRSFAGKSSPRDACVSIRNDSRRLDGGRRPPISSRRSLVETFLSSIREPDVWACRSETSGDGAQGDSHRTLKARPKSHVSRFLTVEGRRPSRGRNLFRFLLGYILSLTAPDPPSMMRGGRGQPYVDDSKKDDEIAGVGLGLP